MHDVLVAGGGLTGATLALALAQQGLKVAVVEAFPPEDPGQPSLDDRTSAIARTGVRILDQLGVWQRLTETPGAIRAVEVSQRGCFGTARIDADAEGLESLGSVVRNRVLGKALWEQLRALENVVVLCPARVQSVTAEAAAVNARIESDGKPVTLEARLLAVAEGAHSPLRDAFGIATRRSDYGQLAVTGLVQVRKVIRPYTAWERFTDEGALALIPAGANRYGFVIMAGHDEAATVKDMDDADLLAHLQRLMGYRAGEFTRVGRRSAYPLALHRSADLTAPRAVLVGAAANSVHPLAAQGFNLALRDIAALGETLVQGGCPPADPGTAELLARYARWRSRDQANVVRFTDTLARLSRNSLFRHLRGLALQAFDLAPGAKPLLARFALGQGGRMSRLARGLPL